MCWGRYRVDWGGGNVIYFWLCKIEMSVRYLIEMLNEVVKEMGLKFWGEFGVRFSFGGVCCGVGRRGKLGMI